MAKRKIKWNIGDVFGVRLKDGTYAFGQISEQMMANVIYCAFFLDKSMIPSFPLNIKSH